MKMAMYRWQVTHASPQPYFASRFHCHDNNNDDNNNNNKIAEAEKEKMEYYSTFIHKSKDGKIYLQHIDDIGIFDGFKFVECFFFFFVFISDLSSYFQDFCCHFSRRVSTHFV